MFTLRKASVAAFGLVVGSVGVIGTGCSSQPAPSDDGTGSSHYGDLAITRRVPDRTRETAMIALQGPLALSLVSLPVHDPFTFAEGVVRGVLMSP